MSKEPTTDRMVRDTDADRVAEIEQMSLALIEKINATGVTRAASHVRLAADMVNQQYRN